jgi:hypothetical protein
LWPCHAGSRSDDLVLQSLHRTIVWKKYSNYLALVNNSFTFYRNCFNCLVSRGSSLLLKQRPSVLSLVNSLHCIVLCCPLILNKKNSLWNGLEMGDMLFFYVYRNTAFIFVRDFEPLK